MTIPIRYCTVGIIKGVSMGSIENSTRWRRKKGIKPREENNNRSGVGKCVSCGISYERIRSEKYCLLPDGKHYYYYDANNKKVSGLRCHECSKLYMRQAQRKNYGIVSRSEVTEYCNKVGYQTEVEILNEIKKFDVGAVLGSHQGNDITLSTNEQIEVKYVKYVPGRGANVHLSNKQFSKSKYLVVKFSDGVVSIVETREILERITPSMRVSVNILREDYVYKAGPKLHRCSTSKDFFKWVEEMKNEEIL